MHAQLAANRQPGYRQGTRRAALVHKNNMISDINHEKNTIFEISLDQSTCIRKAYQALPMVPSDLGMHQGSFLGRLQNIDF